MVEGKWAAVGILGGILAGYYLAYHQVGSATCKDANFTTNIGNLKTQCPSISTYDLIRYYTGQSLY